MAIKGDELVKFATQQFVRYIETPPQVRKENRTSAKASREPWLTRWFGLGPISLFIWWRGRTMNRQR
ncbi:YqzE family protein [Paenibacillus sp. HB172176]|uniref:YqzE family protein n=1 Tax=Paenibacillus sp. HB172176 TaxID=2493690 RepID=UPI00143943B7|nr:YqzE family protein [Paenibacillus sp. HB172176]